MPFHFLGIEQDLWNFFKAFGDEMAKRDYGTTVKEMDVYNEVSFLSVCVCLSLFVFCLFVSVEVCVLFVRIYVLFCFVCLNFCFVCVSLFIIVCLCFKFDYVHCDFGFCFVYSACVLFEFMCCFVLVCILSTVKGAIKFVCNKVRDIIKFGNNQ